MAETRPLAACLGDSAAADFPLVLVLGREYNGSGGLRRQVGCYSFTESSGSTFWNRTYSLISRKCHAASDFKARCIAADLSPVVFANVLPRPIPNELSARRKRVVRLSLPEVEVRNHVRMIFDLLVAGRLAAVVMSVGDGPEFTAAKDQVRAECRTRALPLIELPYLGSRVANEVVDAALDRKQAEILCSVVAAFLADSGTPRLS